MDHYRPRPPRGPEKKIADRLIVDLDGYDHGFIKKICEILDTDYFLDGAGSQCVRNVISDCVMDIVGLFTINPTTLYGTINIGADIKSLITDNPMLEDLLSDADEEEFHLAYKAFASNVFFSLSRKLERAITRGIDDGFTDISCQPLRYRPGMLMLNVFAINNPDI